MAESTSTLMKKERTVWLGILRRHGQGHLVTTRLREILLRALLPSELGANMKVEIRWLEERPGSDVPKDFRSFLKHVDESVTPVAVEETFKAWLKERVEGRNVIISDLEITVDDQFYLLEQEEENRLFQRIGTASGR